MIKWHNYRFRVHYTQIDLNKKGLQSGKPRGFEGRHKGGHSGTDLWSGNQAAIVPDTKTINFLWQYSLQQDNYGVWKTINMHVSLRDLQRSYLLIQDILKVEILCASWLHVWGSCFNITCRHVWVVQNWFHLTLFISLRLHFRCFLVKAECDSGL